MITTKYFKRRSANGSLAGLIFAAVLLVILLVGALATDFTHILAVKNELQNALDAGALAGAQELWNDTSKCEPMARQVASANLADGHAVTDGIYNTTVSVKVDKPVIPLVYGKVTLDGTCRIRNILGGLIGRHFEVVTAHSAAGTTGKIQTVFTDQLFPIAVEQTAGPNGAPLTSSAIGQTIKLEFNAQKYKNAGWTSLQTKGANAHNIWDMIDQMLGLKPVVPGTIPSVSVGDDIALNNGQMAAHKLATPTYYKPLTDPGRPALVLPVVTGDPAMNQTERIIGFIAFRPTDVILGNGGGSVETIVGRVERLQIRGTSGPTDPAGQQIAGLQPGPIQLVE